MGQLDGRVAIVTGAGTGLGLSIARELALDGELAIAVRATCPSGEAAAEELSALGVEARFYHTDVSKSDQVDRSFAAIRADLGSVDILVNNAGISRVGPHTHEVTDEDWHDSIAVMQTGVFFGMRAAGQIMLDQGAGGSIVNISSIRGFSPNPGPHDVLRAQGGRDHDDPDRRRRVGGARHPGQRVAPGIQRTPMWDADVARGAIDEPFYLERRAGQRIGDPREVGPPRGLPERRRRLVRDGRRLHHRRRSDVDPGRLSNPKQEEREWKRVGGASAPCCSSWCWRPSRPPAVTTTKRR